MAIRRWTAVLAAAISLACGRESAPPAPPNLVLISVDTLRADHLGCYGYGRPTSPHFDGLAAQGVLFENAMSSTSWTLPGHASMLTGLNPFHHGAINPGTRIRSDARLLAEVLHARGYHTVGVVNGEFVQPEFGFGRGFDRYQVFDSRDPQAHQTAVLATLRAPGDRPVFVFLHYMRVHAPYHGPESGIPFARPYTGDVEPSLPKILERWKAAGAKGPILSPADLGHLVDLYDGGILAMDALLGQVLEVLATPPWRNTIVLLTSDHGEEFLDHSFLGHSFTLYDEVLHVPLLIRGPGVPAGRRIATLASLVDILPTVLDLLGLKAPAGIDGRSLQPLWQGTQVPSDRTLFLQTAMPLGGPVVLGARTRDSKLIVNPSPKPAEFYRLDRDPGERHSEPESAEAAQLRTELDGIVQAPVEKKQELSPADVERLRALGYVHRDEPAGQKFPPEGR
jgi:arylsulfatase A-like enzyme